MLEGILRTLLLLILAGVTPRPETRPVASASKQRMKPRLLSISLAGVWAVALVAAASELPRELGRVGWIRDHETALEQSRATGRPVFALFQEIPGCRTCISFGEQVLSHPLLVEAIETEFVPLAIYNNRPGKDARILERYREPSFNNPVVRLLDGQGRDLLPRKTGLYSPDVVGSRMIEALRTAGRAVPSYLEVAVEELGPHHTGRALLEMHCYWSGEACLGAIPGLLESRAAHLQGREVVELIFDAARIEYAELLAEARRRDCAQSVFATTDAEEAAARLVFGGNVRRAEGPVRPAPDRDQKRALLGTPLRDLELTPRQALRVNAAVAAGRSPRLYLSPRQIEAGGL